MWIKFSRVVIIKEDEQLAFVLKRILSVDSKRGVKILDEKDNLETELLESRTNSTLIILDTAFDFGDRVNEWVWNRIRLNIKNLEELAGVPILVLGFKENVEKIYPDEYLVFEEMSKYHRYLHSPFLLKDLIEAINDLIPISMISLPLVISRYAPKNIKNGYFHILEKTDYIPKNEEGLKIEFQKRQHIVERIKSIGCTNADVKKAEKLFGEFERNIISRFGNILEIK